MIGAPAASEWPSRYPDAEQRTENKKAGRTKSFVCGLCHRRRTTDRARHPVTLSSCHLVTIELRTYMRHRSPLIKPIVRLLLGLMLLGLLPHSQLVAHAERGAAQPA